MTKTTKKLAGTAPTKPQALPDPTNRENAVKAALLPSANAAAVISTYAGSFGVKNEDTQALMERLWGDIEDMTGGDMKRAEAMLFGQAHALQAIFMNLARRAASQENLKQWEAYLRMALKAQNQCRMTLETLANIKNPPVVFARQANVNNGGQMQINTGMPTNARAHAEARADDSTILRTKLMGATDGERLDAREAGTSGGADPDLETVAAVHRPAH